MTHTEIAQEKQHGLADRVLKTRNILLPALATVVILGIIIGILTVLQLQGNLNEVKTNQAATQAKLTQVQSQLQALAGANGAGGTDLGKLQASLNDLASTLASTDTKINKICDSKSIASETANINGQQSADTNPNYNYYANLTQIMASVCGIPE